MCRDSIGLMKFTDTFAASDRRVPIALVLVLMSAACGSRPLRDLTGNGAAGRANGSGGAGAGHAGTSGGAAAGTGHAGATGGAPDGGAGGGAGTTGIAGRVPARHRPAVVTCPSTNRTPRPEDVCPALRPDSGLLVPYWCDKDSDCHDAQNGRCDVFSLEGPCLCVYDLCYSDTDCETKTVCGCEARSGSNACLDGNCRVDDNCGVGGYCSPNPTPCGGTAQSYYCHTPRDTCLDDADCGSQRQCQYVQPDKTWQCFPLPLCGP